jgi:hypothetical protein
VAAPESGYESDRRNKDTVDRISRCCHRCDALPSGSREVGRGFFRDSQIIMARYSAAFANVSLTPNSCGHDAVPQMSERGPTSAMAQRDGDGRPANLDRIRMRPLTEAASGLFISTRHPCISRYRGQPAAIRRLPVSRYQRWRCNR